MLTRDEVEKIIVELKNSQSCYVSEAHIQLQFAIIGARLLGNQFDFIPEFPGHTAYSTNAEQKTEFDLLVFDKKTGHKTLIEFKYKTKNEVQKNKQRMQYPVVLGGTLQLANHGAQNLNRYDCWRDIYRIEQNVKHKDVNNGFFIFVTNDMAYIKKDGSNSVFCKEDDFSLKPGKHNSQTKKVDPNVKDSSAGAFRKSNPIIIENDYYFEYKDFQDFKTDNVNEPYNKFWYLLVEIESLNER
mgnify:CR=1 FL=1